MPLICTKPRETWQSAAQPVAGPSFEWSDVDLLVVHYAGVANTPDGDPTDGTMEGWLRNVQTYYLGKGYSIGYNVAVDWRGWSWELRGEDFECAANKYVNPRAFAVIVVTDGQDRATPAAIAEVNRILAYADGASPLVCKVLGHWQTTIRPYRDTLSPGTDCPGVGIKAQLAAGDIGLPAPPPPPPPAPPGDAGVLLANGLYRRRPDEWAWSISEHVWDTAFMHPIVTEDNPALVTGPAPEWVTLRTMLPTRDHPDGLNTASVVGKIRSGETLTSAMRRLYPGVDVADRMGPTADWSKIADVNKVMPGQQISIPVVWRP